MRFRSTGINEPRLEQKLRYEAVSNEFHWSSVRSVVRGITERKPPHIAKYTGQRRSEKPDQERSLRLASNPFKKDSHDEKRGVLKARRPTNTTRRVVPVFICTTKDLLKLVRHAETGSHNKL